MQGHIVKKRQQTSYSGPQYAAFDTLYALPILAMHKQTDGSFQAYLPDLPQIYSSKYITAFNTIWSASDGSDRKANSSSILNQPPDDYVLPAPTPYFATTAAKIHLAPQRWMFNAAYLDEHPEYLITRIVDVDEPTHPDDVLRTDWYKQHPLTLRKQAPLPPTEKEKKRKSERSVSIAAPASSVRGETPLLPGSTSGSGPPPKRAKTQMSSDDAMMSSDPPDGLFLGDFNPTNREIQKRSGLVTKSATTRASMPSNQTASSLLRTPTRQRSQNFSPHPSGSVNQTPRQPTRMTQVFPQHAPRNTWDQPQGLKGYPQSVGTMHQFTNEADDYSHDGQDPHQSDEYHGYPNVNQEYPDDSMEGANSAQAGYEDDAMIQPGLQYTQDDDYYD